MNKAGTGGVVDVTEGRRRLRGETPAAATHGTFEDVHFFYKFVGLLMK